MSFKNPTLELLALVEIIIEHKEDVKKIARGNGKGGNLGDTGLFFTPRQGLCALIWCHSKSVYVDDLLEHLNFKYSAIKDTICAYPVPMPRDDWTQQTSFSTESKYMYKGASPAEMWADGGYADNRWEYLDWLHTELLKRVMENM